MVVSYGYGSGHSETEAIAQQMNRVPYVRPSNVFDQVASVRWNALTGKRGL